MYFRGSLFSQCFILSTSLHCLFNVDVFMLTIMFTFAHKPVTNLYNSGPTIYQRQFVQAYTFPGLILHKLSKLERPSQVCLVCCVTYRICRCLNTLVKDQCRYSIIVKVVPSTTMPCDKLRPTQILPLLSQTHLYLHSVKTLNPFSNKKMGFQALW